MSNSEKTTDKNTTTDKKTINPVVAAAAPVPPPAIVASVRSAAIVGAAAVGNADEKNQKELNEIFDKLKINCSSNLERMIITPFWCGPLSSFLSYMTSVISVGKEEFIDKFLSRLSGNWKGSTVISLLYFPTFLLTFFFVVYFLDCVLDS